MRVGIAGSGFMARTHAAEYAEMDVDVVAVASPGGPDDFVAEFGFDADVYTDVATLCSDADIDYLDICTPTYTHRDAIRRRQTPVSMCSSRNRSREPSKRPRKSRVRSPTLI